MQKVLLFLLAVVSSLAQTINTTPVDGLRNKLPRHVAYINCTVVPSPGMQIDSAVIIVRKDRIVAVGKKLAIPPGAEIRDLRWSFVYAGFVEPYLDVSALSGGGPAKHARISDDEDEGPHTPPQQGARHWNQAVRPERQASEKVTVTQALALEWQKLGYGAASICSHDGIFRGSAAGILFRAGTASSTVIADPTYHGIAFAKGSSKTPYPSSQMGSIALIRQTFLDAEWYVKAHSPSAMGLAVTPPEHNISLDALRNVRGSRRTFIAETVDEHDVLRWNKIATEFGVQLAIAGSGKEYRRGADIAGTKMDLILPLNFPATPDVRNPVDAREVPLEDLVTWYWAADNARIMDSLGSKFAFTTKGLKDKSVFLERVRLCVERGLDSTKALAALTTEAARIAGVADKVGRIEKGFYANFIITPKPLFSEGSSFSSVVVAGDEYVIRKPVDVDVRGHWTLTSSGVAGGKPLTVSITGEVESPTASVMRDSLKIPSTFSVNGRRILLTISLDTLGTPGTARTTIEADSIMMRSDVLLPNGTLTNMVMRRDSLLSRAIPKSVAKKVLTPRIPLPTRLPLGAYGIDNQPPARNVVLKNATVWTCGPQGVAETADVLFRDGKIVSVGKGLSADTAIDCTGMHITPGIIDEHSHIAISRGVNEGTHAVTTEVRIGDVVDPDDVNIYRQLSGGVTSTHLLHGSANPMGGQLQYIKLRWGANGDGLKVADAVPTVKFALGENVKQSNWGDRNTVRYPQTRMGVEQIMRDAFRTAREYERELSVNDPSRPVRRDLQLDALVEILNSKRLIHCHSYVQSEILMLIRLAEEFGFKVQTFTHILEGYKVAKEMALHGCGASSFADWWAYKFEVYDAIPENPAILHENGVTVSINSDDAEMGRRLNQEAAKSIAYGDVGEEDALKFVTINAAKQMANDSRTGSIEPGKDADIVVWTGNPLSNFSRVERTFVDGREYFSRALDAQLRTRDAVLRTSLEQAAITALLKGDSAAPSSGIPKREYHCDTDDDEMGAGLGTR